MTAHGIDGTGGRDRPVGHRHRRSAPRHRRGRLSRDRPEPGGGPLPGGRPSTNGRLPTGGELLPGGGPLPTAGGTLSGGRPFAGSRLFPGGRHVAGVAGARWQDATKRALDVVLASAGLLVIAPLLAAVWLAVRWTSPGPAIFRQDRLGRDEHPFTMYKFRTMRVDNSDAIHRDYVRQLLTEDEPATGGDRGLYKLEADPRVTRLGAWLRRTSIDELPQLVNVVRGEMSLVGPRPVLAWEAALFSATARVRFLVLPGLTGLWQVSGRSRLTMRQALDLDVEYVRRRSLRLDLRILAMTLPAQLRRGAP